MVEVEEFCEFYEWDNMTHSWTWDYDYVLGFWFCVGVFHFCVDSFFFGVVVFVGRAGGLVVYWMRFCGARFHWRRVW